MILARKIIGRVAGHPYVTQATFADGDMVIVRECSRGGKSALIGPLSPSESYHTRKGVLPHNAIIGQLPRARIESTKKDGAGGLFMAQFPTLDEYVPLCSRRCTPIYPKDASAILTMLDTSPGDCILEAGTGNAGLSMYLARAVGPNGKVHTVERSSSTSEHAQLVVEQFRRGVLMPSIVFHVGVLGEVINKVAVSIDKSLATVLNAEKPLAEDPEQTWKEQGNIVAPLFDGIVLDMPTPWTQLPQIFGFLKTDRFVVCYLPSISQVIDLVRASRQWPLLVEDVVEVDWRSWDIKVAVVRNPDPLAASDEAMVCRPTHTPIGHTAFLVKLRKCGAQ
ncbi:hypothetical protein IW142_003758 [Coemansia sp. RSA 564]|nr:hypothetical protein IW142_003758 [Coemansia sp. RSA 564]KAJ2276578.1 hypothetical protein GGH14_003510 [Coemansia sp. RSA 370]